MSVVVQFQSHLIIVRRVLYRVILSCCAFYRIVHRYEINSCHQYRKINEFRVIVISI